MAGVIVAAMLGLVRETPAQSAQWALSGFGNATVWLIFAGYMFTLGYTQTGLGKRIALHLVRLLGHSTLGSGLRGGALPTSRSLRSPPPRPLAAPARSFRSFARSRSSMTRAPMMARRGGWARTSLYPALATSFITSSMFVTALAPNTLALVVMRQTAGVTVTWLDWFVGFAPVGFLLLAGRAVAALHDLSAGDSRRLQRRRAGRPRSSRRWAR